MAYLVEERITKQRAGDDVVYPVGADILNGAMIALDDGGNACPAGNGTVSRVLAVAQQSVKAVDLSTIVRARRGCFGFDSDGLAYQDVGKTVYATDDHTVGTDSSKPEAGTLIELEFTGRVYVAWVEIR